jgi:2-oxoglutarate dehydrogenase E1 component
VLYAGRAPAAAPATGLTKTHEAEQNALVQAALRASAMDETVTLPSSLAPSLASQPTPAATNPSATPLRKSS